MSSLRYEKIRTDSILRVPSKHCKIAKLKISKFCTVKKSVKKRFSPVFSKRKKIKQNLSRFENHEKE